MRWNDLAFFHWPVEAAEIRPHVPDGLVLETFEGRAWLGITPFEMSRVRPRMGPPLPRISTFPEVNVRTYVSAEGKPGIWFFSLDAANSLAVRTARLVYGLPYFRASMSIRRDGKRIRFTSERRGDAGPARFRASYEATGAARPAEPGTLEHWLVERYCLYSRKGRRIVRGEVSHAPWPLQPAAARIEENTMTGPVGIAQPESFPLVHFARRLDVVAWLPRVVT